MALKNGKLYKSPFSAYRAQVQGRNPIRFTPMGQPVEWTKELTADFATHGAEYKFHNTLTGGDDVASDIRGHFCDTAAQGEEKGWTQEEHDEVVARLDWISENMPSDVQVWSAPKAEKPWPKYDETHHNQIATLAEQLGNADVALSYERQNQNRPSVIEKLEKLIETAEIQEELVAG